MLRLQHLRYVSGWVGGTAVLSLALGCAQGPFGVDWQSDSSTGSAADAQVDNVYEAQAVAILQQNCTACHTATSGPSNVYDLTDPNHLLSSGLVVPGQPTQSPLYSAVASGAMPEGGSLSPADKQTLSDWITAMTGNSGPGAGGPTSEGFSYLNTNLFQPHCVACHSGAAAPNGYDLSSYSAILASGAIVPDSTSSPAYAAIVAGIMPADGPKVPSTLQTALLNWIQTGAPNN